MSTTVPDEGGGGDGGGGGVGGEGGHIGEGGEGGWARNVIVPTQPDLYGAKTTRPSLAVVAPMNLAPPLVVEVEGRGSQLKTLEVGSKIPTQSA